MRGRAIESLLLLAVVGLVVAGCSAPPQWGTDDETFKMVDALWTAVTAQDVKLVDQCAEKIVKLHDEGHMPDPAFEYLQTVVAKAHSAQWPKARDQLKKLIRAQRR